MRVRKKLSNGLVRAMIWITVMMTHAFAQNNSLDNKVNDTLRGSDKLYAVVAVLVTIFTVLLVYLVYQDLKLKRLQKELQSKSSKNHE